ncbi:CoA pyrophosphatase [Corynebacterium sp. LK28]|uniref:NUDIX hydrolase n=1 Tax=Corynebacterium sp. LK28 TaxID=2044579 RepID=UPI001651E570|nr:CoA pyrophosphatase [Corynebacterium sp. LK28]MBC6794946.1 coenzyme A pyrophosphatase [Corynebacterium sp. LK28]
MTRPSSHLAQWLAHAQAQPELPVDLPEWLRDFARDCREVGIHQYLNDSARIVPETDEHGRPPRYSAVLILLSGDATFIRPAGATGRQAIPADATMLLTHRAPTMRNHSGQVAFPGGGVEEADAGPIDTALREAEEETGLNPDTVEPFAVLQPIYIDRTNFAVVPVVAWWRHPHRVECPTTENDWVEPYPLPELVNPQQRFEVGVYGWRGPAWTLPIGEEKPLVLWGFTGGVINALLRRAGWEEPWSSGGGEDGAEEPHNLFTTLASSANGEALGEMREGFDRAEEQGRNGGAP